MPSCPVLISAAAECTDTADSPSAEFDVHLPADFMVYVAIGLAAQVVDGALGMAYGVVSSSLLLAFGLPPALASASIHAAEVATTGVSGLSHGFFGNVDRRLLRSLAVPGVIGGCAGALLLSQLNWSWLRPLVAVYLLLLGLLILRRAWRGIRGEPRLQNVAPMALGAGFADAVGGGGWGAIITTGLLARHLEPRYAIGTANAAEFFVSLAVSLVFLATLGISHAHVVFGLMLGGVIAAPFAAWLTRHVPARWSMAAVGLMVVLLSGYNILH